MKELNKNKHKNAKSREQKIYKIKRKKKNIVIREKLNTIELVNIHVSNYENVSVIHLYYIKME